MKTDRSGRQKLIDRIKELEADRDRWKDRHELNMKVENLRIKELEARLKAVEGLPDKWRDKEYATATGECPLDIQNCADELEQAIGEQE